MNKLKENKRFSTLIYSWINRKWISSYLSNSKYFCQPNHSNLVVRDSFRLHIPAGLAQIIMLFHEDLIHRREIESGLRSLHLTAVHPEIEYEMIFANGKTLPRKYKIFGKLENEKPRMCIQIIITRRTIQGRTESSLEIQINKAREYWVKVLQRVVTMIKFQSAITYLGIPGW